MTKGIKIGKVAKMLGLNPETLRHYERIGVFTPYQVKENGYRYFSRTNITHLFKARFLHSMGFSLSTVLNENSNGMKLENWKSLLEERKEGLRQEIEKACEKLYILDEYSRQVSEIDCLEGAYRIEHSPSMYFFKFSDQDDEILGDMEDMEEIQKWIELFPISRYSFIGTTDGEIIDTMRGFLIRARDADRFTIAESESVVHLPAKKCIATIVNCQMQNSDLSIMIKVVLDLAANHGFTVDGKAFGTWIFTSQEEDTKRYKYYKIWVPVR